MHSGFGVLIALLTIWSLVWKVYAIWIAVKNNHKKWFFAMLILSTAGILELIYIFKIAKKSWAEVKTDFKNALSSRK